MRRNAHIVKDRHTGEWRCMAMDDAARENQRTDDVRSELKKCKADLEQKTARLAVGLSLMSGKQAPGTAAAAAPVQAAIDVSPFAGFASPFAHAMAVAQARPTPSLHELGRAARTDKVGGGERNWKGSCSLDPCHGYDRWYEMYLGHLRDRPGVRFLEIGMKSGASAVMWSKWFTGDNTQLFGMDYAKDKTDNALRRTEHGIHVFQGDQANEADLARLLEATGGKQFDVIVDDGGHSPTQQLVSFDYLFRHALKPGGVYVVEDIETSYWTNGYAYSYHVEAGLHKRGTTMEAFKQMADTVQRVYIDPSAIGVYEQFGDTGRTTKTMGRDERSRRRRRERFATLQSEADALIETLMFSANCVVLTKKGAWDDSWDRRSQYNFHWAHKNMRNATKYPMKFTPGAVDSVDPEGETRQRLFEPGVFPVYQVF